MPITCDPQTWPYGDKVWNVCRAIALAEGANVGGSAPDRYNNPGDLSQGDEHGQSVSGYVTLPDGEEEIIFATKVAGWMALYKKINNVLLGKSTAYKSTMTWAEIAVEYAGDSKDWLANVTSKLGVLPDARFCDYFASAPNNFEDVQTASEGT